MIELSSSPSTQIRRTRSGGGIGQMCSAFHQPSFHHVTPSTMGPFPVFLCQAFVSSMKKWTKNSEIQVSICLRVRRCCCFRSASNYYARIAMQLCWESDTPHLPEISSTSLAQVPLPLPSDPLNPVQGGSRGAVTGASQAQCPRRQQRRQQCAHTSSGLCSPAPFRKRQGED